ncbi:hypothetical protein NQ317_005358 [Molorchus minor]|uniref:PDZ domain-containing protein n=1 Tax=Molorchus minor TaxID=1323400 RepID=A0ABQ9J1K6_9CUCU|nr:hypothetical protein NQ317_005358 [Molorchus minor]
MQVKRGNIEYFRTNSFGCYRSIKQLRSNLVTFDLSIVNSVFGVLRLAVYFAQEASPNCESGRRKMPSEHGRLCPGVSLYFPSSCESHNHGSSCSLSLNPLDLMGMTVTSGSVTIKKDTNNLIGISIGGGAPLCPCLYIVQIFDNTAASRDGTLQSGDELVSVNGQPVKGKAKWKWLR